MVSRTVHVARNNHIVCVLHLLVTFVIGGADVRARDIKNDPLVSTLDAERETYCIMVMACQAQWARRGASIVIPISLSGSVVLYLLIKAKVHLEVGVWEKKSVSYESVLGGGQGDPHR